ncbi:hypothetical protein JD844_004470 [Phrynosoma platyrhinos]|uniref:Uncharacterized protein n=1 Tax=Phrynosoma platyrhinos TaxID=52577 RepID=A0ABQ7TN05_PHRPL|nr:hypothetical protein JD844_004470 [Phrynosoma platyrhinos]
MIHPHFFFRVLQGELKRLKWQHEEAAASAEITPEAAQDPHNEELLAEARILRQHKSRLETRMQILEDHNKQLESQLQRLRELLLQPPADSKGDGSAASSLASSPHPSEESQLKEKDTDTPNTETAGEALQIQIPLSNPSCEQEALSNQFLGRCFSHFGPSPWSGASLSSLRRHHWQKVTQMLLGIQQSPQ